MTGICLFFFNILPKRLLFISFITSAARSGEKSFACKYRANNYSRLQNSSKGNKGDTKNGLFPLLLFSFIVTFPH